MATAPHLADLELTPVPDGRAEEFLTATLRGFHHEYEAEGWEPGRAVLEPERSFGFTVDDRWISTCTAYSRTLTVPGGTLPVAAVTFVTVQPSYRRRGLLTAMMRHQLADVARRGEPVALLWATEAGIYGRFGYGQATPYLEVSGTTTATAFRPEVPVGPGSVGEVEREEWLAAAGRLHAELLDQRPGSLDRSPEWWAVTTNDHSSRRHGASAYRYALHHSAAGEPDGYLSFRTRDKGEGVFEPGVEAVVAALDGRDPGSRTALWRFVLDLDLVRTFRAPIALDDPLPHQLADRGPLSVAVVDGAYVRLVDVPRALAARRYLTDVDLVLSVRDGLLPANQDRFRLQGGPDGAVASRVTGEADLALDVRDLGAVYLGGISPAVLHRAGVLEERTPGAVAKMTAGFAWSRAPLCLDFF